MVTRICLHLTALLHSAAEDLYLKQHLPFPSCAQIIACSLLFPNCAPVCCVKLVGHNLATFADPCQHPAGQEHHRARALLG